MTDGNGPARFQNLNDSDLPAGAATVDVSHSSLNNGSVAAWPRKDGLAVTGKGRIARTYPMVCGIDLAGTVRESADPEWAAGDAVIVTGWDFSVSHPGGCTERQRLSPGWLTRRPARLSAVQAMAIGTAGLTSMLRVMALEQHGLTPGTDIDLLVTGAAGGVGSVAVGPTYRYP